MWTEIEYQNRAASFLEKTLIPFFTLTTNQLNRKPLNFDGYGPVIYSVHGQSNLNTRAVLNIF